jgi:hypothetical protein
VKYLFFAAQNSQGMKKLLSFILFSCTILLAGCFEITEEVIINQDGTGVYTTTNDMSAIMGIAKQMGGDEAKKLDNEKRDTTFSLATQADSIKDITEEDRALLRKGTFHAQMNASEEKFFTSVSFPFSSVSQVSTLNNLSKKVGVQSLYKELSSMGQGDNPIPGMSDMPTITSVSDYFVTSFSKGVLTRTINKEKYATAADDKFLQSMKDASSMGIPTSSTYIINLPRPAKKVEGKNVKLSEDKKKVTIKTDLDDFFDEPSKLEFRIEY